MPTTAKQRPPQYILDAIGGSYDESKYRWNPDSMSLESLDGRGSYYYGDIPDPSQGSTIVTDLSAYNRSGGKEGGIQLAPGETPYFGFGDSAQGYGAGLMPNSGIFVSTDPNEISAYKDRAKTKVWQGVAKVGAIVGAAALGAQLSGAGEAGAGASKSAAAAGGAGGGAAPAVAGAEIAPNGLVTGAASAAGGGVGTMAGAVPAVGAGAGGAAAASSKGLMSFLGKNRDIIGSVLSGVGDAMAADRAAEAELDILRERQALTAGNYRGASAGAKYRGLAPTQNAPTPAERFSYENYGNWEWRYDPKQGRVVRAPVEG